MKVLILLLGCLLAAVATAQDTDLPYAYTEDAGSYYDTYGYGNENYEYGYEYDLNDKADTNYGYGEQDKDYYGYYGDEDAAYYEYYGYYADDFGGYENAEYYDDYGSQLSEDCTNDVNNKPILSNRTTSCDIKISGMDKKAPKLEGGIDGVYQLVRCYNGRPMYRRKMSAAGEERVLWFSSTFGDWDISRGAEPSELEIVAYGGDMEHAAVPVFVSSWYLGGAAGTAAEEEAVNFVQVPATVQCADGKTPQPMANMLYQPMLSPEEMEKKYESIYIRYSRQPPPDPSVSFTFVVLMVMTGLTTILAIPYFLLRRKTGSKGGSVAASFSQMLQHSKKRSGGHVN